MIVSFHNLLMSLLGAPLSCVKDRNRYTGGADMGLSEELSAMYTGEEHDASDSY